MNKIVKIETEQNTPEIDWSKPQYLISIHNALVYCTGKHRGSTFNGILVSGNYTPHLGNDWQKIYFRPLAPGEIVTVQFSND